MASRAFRLSLILAAGLFVLVAAGAALIWREDILQALLDPKIPFAVYQPPRAPNYTDANSWARLPGALKSGDPPADVFFVHPTTFDGGRDWNGPVGDGVARRRLNQIMIPNYAAPFAAVGRVFIPLYRQASLYTSLSLFDDARDARAYAYGDVDRAFQTFLSLIGPDRPFLIVGVEQGGLLATRLLAERIQGAPALRRRLVVAYLIETIVLAGDYGPGSSLPACVQRDEAGCVAAWISAPRLDFVRAARLVDRGVVWSKNGRLVALAGRQPLCFNPLLGATSPVLAPARLNLGAANATGMEWGTRPGFMVRQIAAQCEGGILRVSQARSAALRPSGGWAQRRRVSPYNLFWADIEADADGRLSTWLRQQAPPVRPLRSSARPGASRTGP